MIRTLSAVVLAFIMGAMGSLLYVQRTRDVAPERNTRLGNSTLEQDAAYQEMLSVKEATIAKLTDENGELLARIEQLTLDQQNAQALEEFESLADDIQVADEDPGEQVSQEDDSEDRRRRGPWNGEPPTPEQQQEFFDRMRGRMVDMWNEEWENATPESQARITAISDYQQELMNGRLAMRDAETDEEREAILTSLEETESLLRRTVSDEQRYRIQTLAKTHDLDTPEGVDAFISETRQLMRSPIFNTGGGWGRSGRGGGFRGPGDGGSRGGDRDSR